MRDGVINFPVLANAVSQATEGLKELSSAEYSVMSRLFEGEKTFNAPDVVLRGSAKYVHPDERAVLNDMARLPELKELAQ